ncbi:DUF4199 domain-containing protein [Rhabdobacter roseus]|uniref:DUF4199 domain-containing protein n=1 Tax=Rhabdobacter roseus TaxID=1655419 RepID=A0A840THD4_9BACT|nr:DUF4199 domain-containing protein [Rhabdobacter roseus]MBB5282671.1 hypothetical protein [Rhabdobacter roseus]
MRKTILVFGLIAGAIVSIMLLVMMVLSKNNARHFDNGELVGYTSMLLAFSLIFIAVKSYRDRYGAGAISFKDAFLLGLGITAVASALYVFTWVVFYTNFYPTFPEDYAQYALEKMKQKGSTAAELSQAQADIRNAFSYYDTWYGLIGITFLEIFPVGLLLSLICALILRRKPAARVVSS